MDWLRQYQDIDYVQHFRHYYKPLVARNIPEGIISVDESLDGFWLVIAPGLVILTPEKAQQLTEFV